MQSLSLQFRDTSNKPCSCWVTVVFIASESVFRWFDIFLLSQRSMPSFQPPLHPTHSLVHLLSLLTHEPEDVPVWTTHTVVWLPLFLAGHVGLFLMTTWEPRSFGRQRANPLSGTSYPSQYTCCTNALPHEGHKNLVPVNAAAPTLVHLFGDLPISQVRVFEELVSFLSAMLAHSRNTLFF